MKKLSTYLLLILFSFQIPSWADDIRDFEIDGMSIGDSLLKFYSKEFITNAEKVIYPGSKKFYGIGFNTSNSDLYEAYTFGLKNNDDKFIIYDLGGMKEFHNDLDNCKKKKKKITDDFKRFIDTSNIDEYEYRYKEIEDGKSVAFITAFNTSDGAVRVYCNDWSENTSKSRGWTDDLNVDLSSTIFLDFLDNDAYK